MHEGMHLAAYPLVTSDPYVSIWSCTDRPAQQDTRHWAGERKRITLSACVDGERYALIGRQDAKEAEVLSVDVTPTCTRYAFRAGDAKVCVSFRAPLLLDDFDLMSTPVTFIDFEADRAAELRFALHDDICYDGLNPAPMVGKDYQSGELHVAWMGKKRQNTLCHTGDHITIDWGYAYLAADADTAFAREGGHWALTFTRALQAGVPAHLLLAYDDVDAIRYFDLTAKAWYARAGKTIMQALHECAASREAIAARCDALDAQLMADARRVGGEAYATLVAASYRHSIAAHKLIADRDGNAIFLSKENDSNGCIGTADVSYPSIPLYLLYAPELVRAMCRPILRFANMPAWKDDFAPHDVGRYPHATGQVYGLRRDAFGMGLTDAIQNGDAYPPLYLDEGEENLYDLRYQMPVEECGNMILMLAAAMRADGDDSLVRAYLPTLEKWVRYLERYGADPGEQLCTDDFAGHLAHNVNLALKAVCGLAAYGWMMERMGETAKAQEAVKASREMAQSVLARAKTDEGTSLTLDGKGWSLKYNAVWDLLFGFELFDQAFYRGEIARYRKEQNRYGVPLDSRADYTKSDWILWAAAMGEDATTVQALSEPIVRYMKETPTRVPFSDWYDTKTGRYCAFIARSVQGGIFMPLLKDKWLA